MPGQREQTSPIFISMMFFEGSSSRQKKHFLLFPCDCPSRTFYSRLWEGPIQLCGGRPIPFLYCATFTLTGRRSDRPGRLSYKLLRNGAQARQTQCEIGWTGWTVAGWLLTLPLLSLLERRRRVKEKDRGSWTTCFPPRCPSLATFPLGISVRVCVKRLDVGWWLARQRYLPPLLCRTVTCSSTSRIAIALSPTGLLKAHGRALTKHATAQSRHTQTHIRRSFLALLGSARNCWQRQQRVSHHVKSKGVSAGFSLTLDTRLKADPEEYFDWGLAGNTNPWDERSYNIAPELQPWSTVHSFCSTGQLQGNKNRNTCHIT